MWRGIAVLLVAVAWGACGTEVTEVTPDDDGSSGTSQGQEDGDSSPGSGGTSAGEGTGASGSSMGTEGVGVSSTSTSTSTSASTSMSTSVSASGTTGSGSTTEGVGPSCDELYGAAPGYILCEETPESCSFNATTNGNCNDMCASLGGACLEAFDNPNVDGEECEVLADNDDDCTTNRQTELCVCSKP